MYEGTRKLQALRPEIERLQQAHAQILALPTGWDRLRTWSGVQLQELMAITAETGPRTARAALVARLFWEARCTAQRFATDEEAVRLFMEGSIKDTEQVTNALKLLSAYLEPELGKDIKEKVTKLNAPMAALGEGKEIRRWPFGKQLSVNHADSAFYDAIGAILNSIPTRRPSSSYPPGRTTPRSGSLPVELSSRPRVW